MKNPDEKSPLKMLLHTKHILQTTTTLYAKKKNNLKKFNIIANAMKTYKVISIEQIKEEKNIDYNIFDELDS